MMKSSVLHEKMKSYTDFKPISIEKQICIDSSGMFFLEFKEDGEYELLVAPGVDVILKVQLSNKNTKIKIEIQENSNVGYYVISENESMNTMVLIHENSYLETYEFFGNIMSETLFHVNLLGYQATIDYKMGLYGKDKESHTHKVTVHHLVSHTHSNINKRAVLSDNSLCTFDVESFIKKGSSQSSAYQKSKIVNLSDTTVSHINPILLIDDYDVMAGHGATISKVQPDELYYLQSRGLTKQASLKLITLGFLLELVPKYLQEEIENKIERMMNHE